MANFHKTEMEDKWHYIIYLREIITDAIWNKLK
jgi:hypothetical protein